MIFVASARRDSIQEDHWIYCWNAAAAKWNAAAVLHIVMVWDMKWKLLQPPEAVKENVGKRNFN